MPPKRKVEFKDDVKGNDEDNETRRPRKKVARNQIGKEPDEILDSISSDTRSAYEVVLSYGSKGATPGQIAKDLNREEKTIMESLNDGMKKGLLEISQTDDGKYLLKAVKTSEYSTTLDLSNDEKIVYDYIKNASSEGIWTKHLKSRTGLHQMVLTQVLKNLEKKQLIKNLRSVKNPTRKMYMLYNLTPSEDVSGGAFYTDQEMDTEFIRQLYEACLKYIRKKSFPKGNMNYVHSPDYQDYPTLDEIKEYISQVGLVSAGTDLSRTDLQRLLDVLVYDKKIIKFSQSKLMDDEESDEESDEFGGSDGSDSEEEEQEEQEDEEEEEQEEEEKEEDDKFSSEEEFEREKKRKKKNLKKHPPKLNKLNKLNKMKKHQINSTNSSEPQEYYRAIKYISGPTIDEVRKMVDEEEEIISSKVDKNRNRVGWISPISLLSKSMTEIPCGKCPMYEFCSEDGPVNPNTCKYLDEWLNNVGLNPEE